MDTITSNGTDRLEYEPNVFNQYETLTYPSSSTVEPAYNADGDMTDDGMWTYAYDGAGRLIGVTPNDPENWDMRTEYAYDYMNRRVTRKVYAYWSGAWVQQPVAENHYLYAGMQCIEELNSSGVPQRKYLWGLDLAGRLDFADNPFVSFAGAGGVGGLLAETNSSGAWCFAYDGNGNIVNVLNADDGTAAASYRYGPYGEPLEVNDMVGNPYRFSTKWTDLALAGKGLALYDYGFRWYHAELGRWLSRDPIEEVGGLNLYLSFANDPLGITDALGLRDKPAAFFREGWDDPPYVFTPRTAPHPRLRSASAYDKLYYNSQVVFWRGAREHFGVMYPNFFRHLFHFLNNSGTPLYIDIDGPFGFLAVKSAPTLKGPIFEIVETIAMAQEKVEADLSKPGKYQIVRNRRRDCQMTYPGENLDWVLAMATYGTWGKAIVEVSDCCPPSGYKYNMAFFYFIEDYYNFNKGDDFQIKGLPFKITSEDMNHLVETNQAAEYWLRGILCYYVQWNPGGRPVVTPTGPDFNSPSQGRVTRDQRVENMVTFPVVSPVFQPDDNN